MSYQQNGKIEATDINTTLAGAASPAAASTTLNAVWGVGSGDRGYGQTPYVPNVTPDSKITAAAWGELVTTTNTVTNHQGLALPVTPIQPTQNALINYDAGYIKTNIDAVNNNRLYAKLQGIGATTTVVNNIVWSDNLTVTFTVSFPSGNQARHFFNAGGQLSLSFAHPAGNAVGSRATNLMFSQLCTACGTIVMSAMNTGFAKIGGGTFTGLTRLGGTSIPDLIDNDKGYYGLSPAYQTVFKQKSSSAVPGYYSDSFIEIKARTNGTVGANGDNGSVIYIQVLFEEIPNGGAVSGGTTLYLTATPPAQAGVVPGAFLPIKSWAMPIVTFTTAATGSGAASISPAILGPATTPVYTLTGPTTTVENGPIGLGIYATNTALGTLVPFTITGVSLSDLSSIVINGTPMSPRALTGTIPINTYGGPVYNTATLAITPALDGVSEGTETCTVTIGTAPNTATHSFTISPNNT